MLLLLGLYGWQTDRFRLRAAFAFAHLSHFVTNHTSVLLSTTPELPSELLWPLLLPTANPVMPAWGGPCGIYVTLWTAFSIAVLTVSIAVLVDTKQARHGTYRNDVTRTAYRVYWFYAPQ